MTEGILDTLEITHGPFKAYFQKFESVDNHRNWTCTCKLYNKQSQKLNIHRAKNHLLKVIRRCRCFPKDYTRATSTTTRWFRRHNPEVQTVTHSLWAVTEEHNVMCLFLHTFFFNILFAMILVALQITTRPKLELRLKACDRRTHRNTLFGPFPKILSVK